MREVICLMQSQDATELEENRQYPILRVSRVTSTLSYENFLAITSMQPNVDDWLTATSGIPSHPSYVQKQNEVRSTSTRNLNDLQILLQDARHMRVLCRYDNNEWKTPEDAKEAIRMCCRYFAAHVDM